MGNSAWFKSTVDHLYKFRGGRCGSLVCYQRECWSRCRFTRYKSVKVDQGSNEPCRKFLTVENHTVKLPDGKVIPDWTWLIIPSAAIVLAMTTDHQFLCFRQTKYAVEGTSLAPVGGMLEPNEKPLDAAKRELLEEMGYESSEWVSFGSHILDPNRGIATMHLFLALNAKRVAEPNSDDLEDQELLFLNRGEIEAALYAGEFKILAWSAVVAMSLNYIDASARKKTG